MEYFVNELGSATIETAIVIPIIIILAVSIILLVVSGFIFSATLLDQLRNSIIEEKDINVDENIRLLTHSIPKKLFYDVVRIKVSVIQNIVEYLIYLSEEYVDVLKE